MSASHDDESLSGRGFVGVCLAETREGPDPLKRTNEPKGVGEGLISGFAQNPRTMISN